VELERYDAERFDPPAPLALVIVKSKDFEVHDVPMLLDTEDFTVGMDGKAIPIRRRPVISSPDSCSRRVSFINQANASAFNFHQQRIEPVGC
jgi:hypothetical protein